MKLRLVVGVLLALVALAPLRAVAQVETREGIALQNQIMDLRRQLDAMQSGRPAGGSTLGGYQPTPLAPAAAAAAAPGALDAQLLDRVQRLEDQMRELRGRIDDADNTRQRQFDDLNKKLDDLSFKLGMAPAGAAAGAAAAGPGAAGAAGGAAGGAAAGGGTGTLGKLPAATATGSATPTALVPPAAAPPPPGKRTAELILQEGNAALARHDYAAAEIDAREVLANSKSPRASDAQFLLAQTLAGRRDYSAAAVAFDDAYNRSHTGSHAQDSLLGLANALAAINEKRAACATLDKLRSEFPTPRADLREPIATARKTAACH